MPYCCSRLCTERLFSLVCISSSKSSVKLVSKIQFTTLQVEILDEKWRFRIVCLHLNGVEYGARRSLLTSRLIKGAFASEGVSHNVGYRRGGKSVFRIRNRRSILGERIIHHFDVKMERIFMDFEYVWQDDQNFLKNFSHFMQFWVFQLFQSLILMHGISRKVNWCRFCPNGHKKCFCVDKKNWNYFVKWIIRFFFAFFLKCESIDVNHPYLFQTERNADTNQDFSFGLDSGL